MLVKHAIIYRYVDFDTVLVTNSGIHSHHQLVKMNTIFHM